MLMKCVEGVCVHSWHTEGTEKKSIKQPRRSLWKLLVHYLSVKWRQYLLMRIGRLPCFSFAS